MSFNRHQSDSVECHLVGSSKPQLAPPVVDEKMATDFDANPFCNNLRRLLNNHKMCRIRDFGGDIEGNNDQDAIFRLKLF